MSERRAAGNAVESYELDGFALSAEFQMPTSEELELDLALGKPGWKGLLRSSQSDPKRHVSQTSWA